MKKTKVLSKFQKIVIYFVIYAFIGWLCEEIYCVISTHEFVKRGFLFGPICPIYGYGAIILILFFKDYKNKPVQLFFLSSLIFTIFEYITDFSLQALFGLKWWDYTGEFLNVNGRITLSFSIIWGIRKLNFHKTIAAPNNQNCWKDTKKNPNKNTKSHIKYTYSFNNCRYFNIYNNIFTLILT